MELTTIDLVCCAVATVGIAQAFVRAEGGPGAWLRDKVCGPVLERCGMRKLADCPFCASVWVGLAMAIVLLVEPTIVRAIAAAVGGAALVWISGEAPRRKGQGCGKAGGAAPAKAPETALPEVPTKAA